MYYVYLCDCLFVYLKKKEGFVYVILITNFVLDFVIQWNNPRTDYLLWVSLCLFVYGIFKCNKLYISVFFFFENKHYYYYYYYYY